MKWDPLKTFDTLSREGRRILESAEHLSTDEISAFAGVLFELSFALTLSQPWPLGREASLSQECLDLFRKAAEMAESERREHAIRSGCAFTRYSWRVTDPGVVVAFPAICGPTDR